MGHFGAECSVSEKLCLKSPGSELLGIHQPQRHREHRGCTEKSAVWTLGQSISEIPRG